MKEATRIYTTDCEGPISINDNAFELTSHFLPEGEKFFAQISRYDDVLADIVKRRSYKAGDTLKLILPFLRAYNVTNEKMVEFAAQSILLMPGAMETLQLLKETMPTYIVSTSYETYIRVLCKTLDFPFENTYCTTLNIDAYEVSSKEQEKIKQLRQEICSMSKIEIPEGATSLYELSKRNQRAINRLDEIFWEEIPRLKSGAMLEEITPIGGIEKAKVVKDIIKETGSDLRNVIYVGDSITDVECFRLVRDASGLAISFNGNTYAIREAEIAILSNNALAVVLIADVFKRLGKDSVLKLIENWSYGNLKSYGVRSFLQDKFLKAFPTKLPKASKITASNMKELIAESNAFRKSARGEKVGGLG